MNGPPGGYLDQMLVQDNGWRAEGLNRLALPGDMLGCFVNISWTVCQVNEITTREVSSLLANQESFTSPRVGAKKFTRKKKFVRHCIVKGCI
jgi:hypothetical protein